MAPIDTLLAFLAAAAIFALMPGPAILYATARTLAGGRRAGLMAALGIALGGYIHVVAAAAGLSALFHAVPTVYALVKLAGAAYLVWLGWGMIRSKATTGTPQLAPQSPARAFRQSVLVELLNPKTALFFVAFLPQFADPAAAFPVWLQLLILGTVVNLMFGLADLVAVFLASTLASRLGRSTRAVAWMNRAGGALLMGLGLRLAADRA